VLSELENDPEAHGLHTTPVTTPTVFLLQTSTTNSSLHAHHPPGPLRFLSPQPLEAQTGAHLTTNHTVADGFGQNKDEEDEEDEEEEQEEEDVQFVVLVISRFILFRLTIKYHSSLR